MVDKQKLDSQKFLTVSALTAYLKQKFVRDPYLQEVYLVGEVSNFRLRPNGHQYFRLKDDRATISVVMYKSQFAKVPFKLEEGMKVFVKGYVSLYESSGSYQMYLEDIQPDGVGALYQALEQLKEEFRKSGLFEQRQGPIKRFPERIAVITSPSGAVIRDIITTIKRRYPIVDVVVFPSRVQGKEAAGEIVAAFEAIRQQAQDFDTIILARGGGSIEDLWPFNEKVVAHAILASPLPVISSVGHETDTTIADLVADLRAPTPTAAAELAVPVLNEVLMRLDEQQLRLGQAMTMAIQGRQDYLKRITDSYIFKQPDRLYQAYSQNLDLLDQSLQVTMQTVLNKADQAFQKTSQAIQIKNLQQSLVYQATTLKDRNQALQRATLVYLQSQNQALKNHTDLLEARSPLQIMQQGYALVTQADKLVKSYKDVKIGETIEIQFTDGSIYGQVIDQEAQSQNLLDSMGEEQN